MKIKERFSDTSIGSPIKNNNKYPISIIQNERKSTTAILLSAI